jgi:SAM-dependent methyltransferase
MPAVTAYEAVPYDDRPVAETHVDHLHAAARLAGLAAAPAQHARVLELGCAHAVNLLPQAMALPEASFVGVDISPRQIEVAQRRVQALGLSNVRVQCADVMDLDLGDERFDYVVAHGLFSWVPDPVRDRVLALSRQVLAPDGVLYLSYNAMPAWGIRAGIRRALFELVGDATDEPERVRRARAGLELLRTVQPLAGTAEGALMAEEIEGLRDKPDAYLLHEYLVPFSRAYWLREIVGLAHGAGLHYLDDVAPTGLAAEAVDSARAQITRSLSDRARDSVAVEQLMDVVTFRQFRASLWCRDDASCSPRSAGAWLAAGWLAAEPREPAAEDPILAAVCARWPADLPFTELEAVHGDREALAQHVFAAHRSGDVQVRLRSVPAVPQVSARPGVSALTRLEASELTFVTTPRHAYAPLDPFHAALIRLLDGTRTVDDLVAALATELRTGRLHAAGAAPEQVIAALPRLVPSGLVLLHRAGLLTS